RSELMAALSLLLLAALLWVPVGTLTCYGDSGQPVDWFVVYKLPAHSGPGDAAQRGLRYKYLDEDSGGWRDGAGLISSPTGALAFLLYNDQPPQSSGSQDSSSRGHTKGVLLLDQEGGFWLIHSVPNFPPPASSAAYSWPPSAQNYGQTLICVSFPLTQFLNISRQLTYTYPLVYDHRLEGDFAQKFHLEEVVKGHHVRQGPWNSSITLTSNKGHMFQSFAKFGNFGDEDHSKWCVAPERPWACVGDMNRNKREEHRGGGTLCAQLPTLWKAFQPLVKAWEPCGK
ncbi:hypothetical protein E2I00_001642, partial [Balaenoptera physalus]